MLCIAKYSHIPDNLSIKVKLFRPSRSTLMMFLSVFNNAFSTDTYVAPNDSHVYAELETVSYKMAMAYF
jgi:hypothetical protein